MAIVALVLGISSIVLVCLPYVTIFMGIAAVVLGIVALRKARAGQAVGAGLAKAGLITGIIGIVLSVVVFIAGAAIFAQFGDCTRLPTQAEQQQCILDKANN